MTSGSCRSAADAAEGLYRIVDAAYEHRSVAISSNLHPRGFDELMPKTLATATVDRLLHHAHVCQTSGDSVRLTQALARKRSNPTELTNTTMANPAEPISGQICWPSPGSFTGHQRAHQLAARGQKLLAIDRAH